MQPRPSLPVEPPKFANGADAFRIASHDVAAAAAAGVEIDRTIEDRVSRARWNKPRAPHGNRVPNNVIHNVNHNVNRVARARKATGPTAASACYPRKCSRFRSPTF